jgi:hypothetical protein
MRASPQGHGAAVLTGVHLAAVTVWAGALLHSVRAAVAWRRAGSAVRWVPASYVRMALWTYLVVVATGVVSLLVLVPLPQLVSTTFGRVLLIKLGLVSPLSAAALSARLVHRHPDRSARLRRLMAAEISLLAVVLVAGAVLVSTPPPTPTAAASASAAPQPVGLVLPLGTLVGQVGISVTAAVAATRAAGALTVYETVTSDTRTAHPSPTGLTSMSASSCRKNPMPMEPQPSRREPHPTARQGAWRWATRPPRSPSRLPSTTAAASPMKHSPTPVI